MLRRELIKSIAAIPFVKHATLPAVTAKISENHIMLFFDDSAMDVNALTSLPGVPGLVMEFIPLCLIRGQTVDDAVKLYRVSEDGQEKAGPKA